MFATLTAASQYWQRRPRGTSFTASCRPGDHKLWAVAEGTLPSCGGADAGRAGSSREIPHCESISCSDMEVRCNNSDEQITQFFSICVSCLSGPSAEVESDLMNVQTQHIKPISLILSRLVFLTLNSLTGTAVESCVSV